MQRIRVQLTTRSGPAGSKPDAVLQAAQDGTRKTIPDRELSERFRMVLDAAVQAADAGLVTEVRVQVYPVGIVIPAHPGAAKNNGGR